MRVVWILVLSCYGIPVLSVCFRVTATFSLPRVANSSFQITHRNVIPLADLAQKYQIPPLHNDLEVPP